jgi:intergrase/recombinase
LNPGPPAPQTETVINWDAFEVWVSKDHRPAVARDIVSYAKRFSHCLLKRDLSEVRDLRETLRPNVVKALSSLAKYLGIHEQFKKLVKDYGLTWKGKATDDLVIERLVRTKDPDEVFAWVKEVKRVRPDIKEFMDFISVSGLRLNEAVQSYNLIVRLSREGKLNQYYNEQTETLEHFRFKEVFIRKSKKAFISFIPKELIEKVKGCEPLTSKHSVQQFVKKQGLKIRFADIREAHNTLLTKYLNQSEIDFIAGRVSSNVFMSNYYNPKMVSDLKERVFKAIAEIETKIS